MRAGNLLSFSPCLHLTASCRSTSVACANLRRAFDGRIDCYLLLSSTPSRRANRATCAQSASSFPYWSLGPITPRCASSLGVFTLFMPLIALRVLQSRSVSTGAYCFAQGRLLLQLVEQRLASLHRCEARARSFECERSHDATARPTPQHMVMDADGTHDSMLIFACLRHGYDR